MSVDGQSSILVFILNKATKGFIMNIFILSEEIDPQVHYRQNAEFHCDKHVVKMIAESAQILVTALHGKAYPEFGTYIPDSLANFPCKPLSSGHAKHPCVEWTCKSIIHFNYVARLAQALCNEHQYRYPLSCDHTYSRWIDMLVSYLTRCGIGQNIQLPTQFAVAVKNVTLRSTATPHLDALRIYREYYFKDKKGFATWRRRQKPVWWLLMEDAQAN